MKYKNTVQAIFLDRPNRFIAHVDIGGQYETVHVKNTGRCRELLYKGVPVILEKSDNTVRKTQYDLIVVYKENVGWINIDSQAPNKVAYEWLLKQNYDYIKPEYIYGESRIDFYMEKNDDKFLMEVKGCTLERGGKGYFPDAPTQRGIKHLNELAKAVEKGYNCSIAFVVGINNVSEVFPNGEIDPAFEKAYNEAVRVGVKVEIIKCEITPDSFTAL